MIRYICTFLLRHFSKLHCLSFTTFAPIIEFNLINWASKLKQLLQSKTINFDSSEWHRGHRIFEKNKCVSVCTYKWRVYFMWCVYCFWCAIYSTFQFSTFYDLLNWIIIYLFYICTFKLKIARLFSSSLFWCIQKASQMVWNSFCVEMWV